MKDEIKEILFLLHNDRLTESGKRKLEDYITNLQEYYNDNVNKYEELIEKYHNLQEENERLKENAIHNDKVVDKARWNEMIYKKRMDKAIDKIKDKIESNNSALSNLEHTIVGKHELLKLVNYDYNVLLNILQGSDE